MYLFNMWQKMYSHQLMSIESEHGFDVIDIVNMMRFVEIKI